MYFSLRPILLQFYCHFKAKETFFSKYPTQRSFSFILCFKGTKDLPLSSTICKHDSVNSFFSFLSLPARHLCHHGLGRPWMNVRSIYQQVNYDPAMTDLIFIRASIYSRLLEGGLQLIFLTYFFYPGTVYPKTLFTLQDLLPCFGLYLGRYSRKPF
jgi:hypothetical protein